MKILLILFFSAILVNCGKSADSRYKSGYKDGYAVGYNTTCKLRSNLIEGDWDDENYSKGYNDGHNAGSAECLAVKGEDS